MNIGKLFYDTKVVTELLEVLGEYSFRLERIPEVKIKVKLYRCIGTRNVYFKTSHFIKTPEQCSPYVTSVNYTANEETALERAIGTITDFYQTGIECGYEPNSSWLVENPCY